MECLGGEISAPARAMLTNCVVNTVWYSMVFQCDPYESMRDSRRQPLFTYYLLGHNGVPRFFSKFSPVGRSMAEFQWYFNVTLMSPYVIAGVNLYLLIIYLAITVSLDFLVSSPLLVEVWLNLLCIKMTCSSSRHSSTIAS
jgi:hypothetical protein